MKKWLSVGLILVLHLGIANNVLSYTVNEYSPSEYLGGSPEQLATMEMNLGISGLVIEDFFDLDLVPGLTITGPTYLGTNDWPNAWGDPNSRAFIAYPTSTDFATIEIAPGADMVGIGIGYMEYESLPSLHSIMTINNNEVIAFTPENFPNFTFATVTRNGYITITRDEDDPPITSIIFQTSITAGDAYSFDYIAIEFLKAKPPRKPGNPGLPGCLAEVEQLRSQALVPQTGQTKCYDESNNPTDCAGTGQDGDLQRGVPWSPDARFTDDGDTVTDNLTGLMWPVNAQLISPGRNWFDALDACNNLDFAGYDDWWLPNINELISLIDWGNIQPSLPNNHPFLNVSPSEYYWTSTTVGDPPGLVEKALAVRFNQDPTPILVFTKITSVQKYVWCVRGGN